MLSASTTSSNVAPAQGIANPTLSLNLGGIRDYASGLQFLDQMKMARQWHGERSGGNMEIDELEAGGHLDADGWPTRIPDGVKSINTLWHWHAGGKTTGEEAARKAGVYIVDYEGEGTVRVWGDVKVLSSEPGRIVVDLKGQSFFLGIQETDPNGTGEYVRDVTMVAEKHYDLFQAGAVFNPDWLAVVEDARHLRFMDWGETNSFGMNPNVEWEDRPTHGGMEGKGVPLEDMVALANQTRADPWFTIPHGATEEYVREYATYVRDNLDPSLKAHVEWSNEAWNFGFSVTHWAGNKAHEEWGTPGISGYNDYHAKMAVETALIWKDVFGDQAEARLVNVLATQTANAGVTQRMLDPILWARNEPDTYVDPKTVFDALGVTTYFGHAEAGGTYRAALLAAIKDPEVDATNYLFQALQDPKHSGSIPQITQWLERQKALVEPYGIDLIGYEGGQHVHQMSYGLNEQDAKLFDDFMTEFVRSPQMATLYDQSWDSWAEVSDGPYMQFSDVGRPSKYGSWSYYENLDTPTLRGAVLEERNAAMTPWWTSEDPGDKFQQGVILNGTEGDDVMVGTIRDDFLIGGAGNDIFRGGGGHDGIHGGAGLDRAVFRGSVADYTVTIDGKGYRVEGPDGTDRIVDIEDIEFDGGIVVHLSDLTPGIGGVMPLPVPPTDFVPDVPPTDPVPDPNPAPQAVTFESLVADRGRIADISDGRGANFEINAINTWSAAGQLLGLNQSGSSAYTTNERGVVVTIGGQEVKADYMSLNEGRTGWDAAPLPGDALSVARAFGTLVSDTPVIRAGIGNDRFYGRDKADAFDGGGGDDYMAGGAGDDILSGGVGNDVLNGGKGNDILLGGDGVDVFRFRSGEGVDRVLDYGKGDILDMIGWFGEGSATAHISYKAEGAVLSNGTDSVTLVGMTQKDAILIREVEGSTSHIGGSDPNEGLIEAGMNGKSVVVTSLNAWGAAGKALGIHNTKAPAFAVYEKDAVAIIGNQEVKANYMSIQENRISRDSAPLSDNPIDTIEAFGTLVLDAKTIVFGNGNDRFEGRDEASTVLGKGGHDALFGGGGNDTLDGGAGNDYIDGGTGDDILVGGEGADTFKFNFRSGQDVVRDFAAEDRLHLADWFPDGKLLDSALSFDDQGAMLSNGTDTIQFEGVFEEDLSWFHQSIL